MYSLILRQNDFWFQGTLHFMKIVFLFNNNLILMLTALYILITPTFILILPLILHISSLFILIHILTPTSLIHKLNLSPILTPQSTLTKFLQYKLSHQSLYPLEGQLGPVSYHLIYRTIITIWPPLQLLILHVLLLLSTRFHTIYHINISHPPTNTSSLPFPSVKNRSLIKRQLDWTVGNRL